MASLKVKEVLCLLYSGVLFISGAVLVGFAIVLCFKFYYHSKFVPAEVFGPFVILFFSGLAHLLIAWVGVKGPTKEHDFFIIVFVVFCGLLFFFEISVGVWSTVQLVGIEKTCTELMVQSQNNYIRHKYDRGDWDRLEKNFECCGINGTGDYFDANEVPTSCFKCGDKLLPECHQLQEIGCLVPFISNIKNLLIQGILVGFISGLYQVTGVFSYIVYYRGLKEERAVRAANRASRLRQSLYAQRVSTVEMPRPHAPSAPT